jgi:hypothetical protein
MLEILGKKILGEAGDASFFISKGKTCEYQLLVWWKF